MSDTSAGEVPFDEGVKFLFFIIGEGIGAVSRSWIPIQE